MSGLGNIVLFLGYNIAILFLLGRLFQDLIFQGKIIQEFGYAIVCIIAFPLLLLYIVHIILMFKGVEERKGKAYDKIRESMIKGEKLKYCSIALRPYALFSRRSVIGVTDSRVIYLKRPVLGGFKMTDVQWKDTYDAELSENIIPNFFGSEFKFAHRDFKENILINVKSDEADRYAQKQDLQECLLRALEESRAQAGGI